MPTSARNSLTSFTRPLNPAAAPSSEPPLKSASALSPAFLKVIPVGGGPASGCVIGPSPPVGNADGFQVIEVSD